MSEKPCVVVSSGVNLIETDGLGRCIQNHWSNVGKTIMNIINHPPNHHK